MTDFEKDCLHWYKKLLVGKFKHWCPDWDYLPIDETCAEFMACLCYEEESEAQAIKEKMIAEYDEKRREIEF